MFFSHILVIILLHGSCDGFGVTDTEDFFVGCLLHRIRSTKCSCLRMQEAHTPSREKNRRCHVHVARRETGSQYTESSRELDASNEYVCALTSYNNGRISSMRNIATCSRWSLPYRQQWRQFLSSRKYQVIPQIPHQQNVSTNTATATFDANGVRNYRASDLVAADIVVTRCAESDKEVYGKYLLTATIQLIQDGGLMGGQIVVHEGLQETCPSNHIRFFVADLNAVGLGNMSVWFQNLQSLKLTVTLTPLTQIVQDDVRTYKNDRFDIAIAISSLVLHMKLPANHIILPLRTSIFERSGYQQASRSALRVRRSLSALKLSNQAGCHRAPYNIDFTHNPDVVLTDSVIDVGKCVGSCEGLLFSADLNTTNHARTMKSEEQLGFDESTNQASTICCTPISYTDLYFMFRDENDMLIGTYSRDMVSGACGCR